MPRRGDGQEFDAEADRPERAHLVYHLGRDRLGRTGSELDLEGRLARHREAQPPLVHHDPPPTASAEAMRTAEASRHGLCVPTGAGADKTQTVGRFGPIAKRAGEQGPEPGRASRVVGHPGSKLERGTVTDMLAVATGELRHPVPHVVLVVAGDRTLHRDERTPGFSKTRAASIRLPSRLAGVERRAGEAGAATVRATGPVTG